MKWEEGQVFQCPDESCGCEVTISRAPANPERAGENPPTCCCGSTMQLKQEATARP